ncbi:MAG TPA: hypothetical protein VMP01_13955 [Pirellulaceae bacterium]|nr:hypothetical protein [Pirellulaceae bacterium]
MESIPGTYHNGQVSLDGSVQWPEGSRVNVTLFAVPAPAQFAGLDEETWIDTPESRDWLVAEWEALEPPSMTDEEWSQWQAARQAVKEYTTRKMQNNPPPSDR